MMYKINNEAEYRQVMERIEGYLQKSTQNGGAQRLSTLEKEELRNLSLLAESWEDGIPLMPIKQPLNNA